MYISNLSIKNFRNFTTFDIDLKPFTLIIGENNTGKSNMLEALCLLLGQEIIMTGRDHFFLSSNLCIFCIILGYESKTRFSKQS